MKITIMNVHSTDENNARLTRQVFFGAVGIGRADETARIMHIIQDGTDAIEVWVDASYFYEHKLEHGLQIMLGKTKEKVHGWKPFLW
jgi:hypothetical protein